MSSQENANWKQTFNALKEVLEEEMGVKLSEAELQEALQHDQGRQR
jgi:benzoyl-CoA reductase/2-hydroxyglutaryl-CoA dehydratase subunit BcrC/BadD/HgdB